MKAMKKLRSRAGMSLAETLLAVLILLLVSVILVRGVPAAKTAYEGVTLGANAQVLLSTTVSSLRDQLGTARDVTADAGKTYLTYCSVDTGCTSKIYLNSDDGKPVIMVQDYVEYMADQTDPINADLATQPRLLVSDTAATNGLYVTYGSIDYDNASGLVTVTGLSVKTSTGSELASLDTLLIRVITAA